MNTLADLVKTRSTDLDIQITRAQHYSPDEIEWLKHKKMINNLPGDYVTLLKERLLKNPRSIEKINYKNHNNITINFPEYSEKFRTFLEIIEHKESGVIGVCYMSYNKDLNTVYINNIVGSKIK